jgi:hypothetical protein
MAFDRLSEYYRRHSLKFTNREKPGEIPIKGAPIGRIGKTTSAINEEVAGKFRP